MDAVILPEAPWRHRAGLDALIAALGEGHARFVGGAVRDTLLGLEVSDIDIATVHQPHTVIKRLRANGITVVPTGLKHGTVTAVLPDGPIEVTTLRRDVETHGRHATVAFTDDWCEDAGRRDFTINALYADPATGEVFDPFGGLDDLAAGRVRFIGDPLLRIAEDHLRILRYFRFHARFGGAEMDGAALDACAARANDLMALSRERIADELTKLLPSPRAPEVLRVMVDRGVLRAVLPEIDAEGVARLEELAAREAEHAIAPDPDRRLAALLPDDPALAEEIAIRLRLSNARRKRLAAAVVPLDPARPPRALAYRIGVVALLDRALRSAPDAALPAILAAIAGWTPPRLPLGGGRLVALGVTAGPDVAQLMKQVEDAWIAEDFPDSARVDQLARDVADHWLRAHNSA
ncbi:CCA tRNA nucleotidyltransferase [Sphingomonas gilva]|uniref:CCA tRNA nucleotidyltransferase n=1 Tax=Sphingomonas gilva TaxID=2305907 RepID=A0A396RPX2_9SPHN|nr:CCA tRNA nucleotidyltransferase [Sphingomonas gilva]RHW17916.1 CCA tRNA nucleotidyltransferase [Sphingomonas gilva]